MEHWLDHFSKQLALTAMPPFTLQKSRERVDRAGPCMIRQNGDETTYEHLIQSTFDGKAFTLNSKITMSRPSGASPFPSNPGVSSSLLLTLAGSTVLDIQRQSGVIGSRVQVTYGAAFQGVQQAVFTAGKDTVIGAIDGRRTLPLPIRADISVLRFEDGKPEPFIQVDPRLREAIAGILKQDGEAAKSCLKRGLSQQTAVLQGSFQAIVPFTTGGVKCTNCIDTCDNTQEWCVAIFTAGCFLLLFGEGACEAAALAGCSAEWVSCNKGCDNPGGDCCPVYCSQRERCCDDNDTCDGVGECCPQGQVVCSGVCCPAGITACNQGTCCPAQQAVCSGVCCAPGQSCSNEGICCPGVTPVVSCQGICCGTGNICTDGVCCPPGQPVCNGVCCPGGGCDVNGNCCGPPNHFCGGSNLCCPPFNVCCGNVCCDTNARCVNGLCCPEEQVCGGICCPSGQVCLDPSTQTCGTCPPGLVACLPNGTNKLLCCAPGLDCCNSVCCAPGERCCPRQGALVCVPESCIR